MTPASIKRPKSTKANAVAASKTLTAPSSLASDASPSDPDILRKLCSVLLRTRMLEEQVLSLVRAGKVPGTAIPVLGGEATEVASCIGLQPGDSFSSTHPVLATHVVHGTPLDKLFAEIFGGAKPSATSATAQPAETFSVIPPASSITGQFDISAGVALSYRQQQNSNVVVALSHDGLAALGFWHEAASLAARHRLPVVFVVENCAQSHPNGTSVVHSDEDLRDRAEAYGFPGITVDGNDLVAVWRVTQESIHRARTGAGPTLIECCTWRWHAESDSAPRNGHSSNSTNNVRWQHDPLHHMEHYMKKRNLWNAEWAAELSKQYQRELQEAVKSASR